MSKFKIGDIVKVKGKYQKKLSIGEKHVKVINEIPCELVPNETLLEVDIGSYSLYIPSSFFELVNNKITIEEKINNFFEE